MGRTYSHQQKEIWISPYAVGQYWSYDKNVREAALTRLKNTYENEWRPYEEFVDTDLSYENLEGIYFYDKNYRAICHVVNDVHGYDVLCVFAFDPRAMDYRNERELERASEEAGRLEAELRSESEAEFQQRLEGSGLDALRSRPES